MDNNNLTTVFVVDNEFEENLILRNSTFNKSFERMIVCYDDYSPTLLNVDAKGKNFRDIFEKIKKNIRTDWIIFLKPYELLEFSIKLKDLTSDIYNIIIETMVDPQTRRNNLNVFEERLFHKNTNILNEEPKFYNMVISDYYGVFKDNQDYDIKKHQEKYESGNYSIDNILFLVERNLLNIPLDKLENDYLNDKKSPSLLGMYKYISKTYLSKNDFINTERILIKGLNIFPDSPSLHFQIAELYFKNNLLDKAEIHLKECTEMSKKSSFYKFYRFPISIITYLPHFQLGRLYKAQDKLEEAKSSYEECLIYRTEFEPAEKELENVINELKKIGKFVNELSFSCQMCGNCCRYFKIPLTNKDIKNILDNRPDLKSDDFLRQIPIKGESESIELINSKGEKMELALKTKPNSRECMFLDDKNACLINDFKPLACRIWPFSIEKTVNPLPKWDARNRDFIKKYCKHKLEDNATDPQKLESYINQFHKEGLQMLSLTDKWNKNENKREKYNDDFIKYLMDETL